MPQASFTRIYIVKYSGWHQVVHTLEFSAPILIGVAILMLVALWKGTKAGVVAALVLSLILIALYVWPYIFMISKFGADGYTIRFATLNLGLVFATWFVLGMAAFVIGRYVYGRRALKPRT